MILANVLDIIFTRTGCIIMYGGTVVICTYDYRILDLIDVLFLMMINMFLLFCYGTRIIVWCVRGEDILFCNFNVGFDIVVFVFSTYDISFDIILFHR